MCVVTQKPTDINSQQVEEFRPLRGMCVVTNSDGIYSVFNAKFRPLRGMCVVTKTDMETAYYFDVSSPTGHVCCYLTSKN